MSRRDTIVVAVLINTGLLLILFVTAINSSDEKAQLSYESMQPSNTTEVVDMQPAINNTSSEDRQEPVAIASESFESRANEEQHSLANSEQALGETADEDTFVEVVVKRGDYLEKIAKNHSVGVSDIVKLNGLTSTQLKIGQLIRIPILAKQEPVAVSDNKPNEATASNGQEKYYVVRSGDNPWLIAMRNGIDLEQLLKLNRLDEKKARKLRPGDKIRIR